MSSSSETTGNRAILSTVRGTVRAVLATGASLIVLGLKAVLIHLPEALWRGLIGWLDSIRPRIIVFVFIPLFMGLAAVVAVDYMDKYLTTDIFCVKACHVMEYPYEELQKSTHWDTPSGVRPTCADCHVSQRLTFAMLDHFIGTGELFMWYTHDFSEKESFDWLRPSLAQSVRLKMLEDDSANCRGCHVFEAIKPTKKRGQKQHKRAIEEGTTCIVCHYNLVHEEVKPSQGFLKRIDEIDAINRKMREEARLEKEREEAEKRVPLMIFTDSVDLDVEDAEEAAEEVDEEEDE